MRASDRVRLALGMLNGVSEEDLWKRRGGAAETRREEFLLKGSESLHAWTFTIMAAVSHGDRPLVQNLKS